MAVVFGPSMSAIPGEGDLVEDASAKRSEERASPCRRARDRSRPEEPTAPITSFAGRFAAGRARRREQPTAGRSREFRSQIKLADLPSVEAGGAVSAVVGVAGHASPNASRRDATCGWRCPTIQAAPIDELVQLWSR